MTSFRVGFLEPRKNLVLLVKTCLRDGQIAAVSIVALVSLLEFFDLRPRFVVTSGAAFDGFFVCSSLLGRLLTFTGLVIRRRAVLGVKCKQQRFWS